LEHLAEVARTHGIEELEADVMGDNEKMREVFDTSGFKVRQSCDANVYHVTFPVHATETFLDASVARERHGAVESMRPFFAPTSIALVGASRRDGSIGRTILSNLRRCGFHGAIYPVNPQVQELDGLPCFPSVRAIAASVDLAIVAVPASAVRDVVADCARAGVRAVVVISSGFAETSPEGRDAQRDLCRLARASGMRIIGPNCMGILCTDPAVSMNATFAPDWPPAGGVAMLSQSGALGLAMLDHAAQRHIGIASFVSVGNKADVSGNDLLSYWAEDPNTRVIALYLESFGNPRKFARIAPSVARRKPIVALKSGRSSAGMRAAASHSAALTSLDAGVDAVFAQAGVIRTNTMEELFDVVALLEAQPFPVGPRVGVITNAGGPGILFADACETRELTLPNLGDRTLQQLRAFLPPHAGLSNPVDMTAAATPEQFACTIEAVGSDPDVDALVVIYVPPYVTKPEEIAEAIARAAGSVPSYKPLVSVFMSSKGAPSSLSSGPRGALPSYRFPENAAMALAAAMRYARWRRQPRGNVLALAPEREHAIREIMDRARTGATQPFWVEETDLAKILWLADISLAPFERVAPDADTAAIAANRMGYPVVLKAIAHGVVHKSDLGGVLMGLDSEDVVRRGAETLTQRVHDTGHRLEGFLVQRQVNDGIEAFVGVATDPSLGPLLVAGLGGLQLELLRDITFRITPASDRDAADMLSSLRAAKVLDGIRGAPPADREALVLLIQRVSALVEAFPELLELDLNPVKVLARGEGVIAVDARMRLAPHG